MRKLVLILSILLATAGENIYPQQEDIWTLEKCIEYALVFLHFQR
jgi:hypothetical protein